MLIKCSECGKKFSDNASACPHCGCPITAQKTATPKKKMDPQEKKKTIIVAIVAFVVVAAVWLILSVSSAVTKKKGKEAFESALYNNGGTPITSIAKEFENWTKSH